MAKTDDGHASAYGFANGTADGSTAGFGGKNLDEIYNVIVNAENIITSSKKGASSSIGFARFMQGYTHDCTVNILNKIEAINEEGDEEENKYAYMNGSSYAYGFMLNTGGSSIPSRRSFINNTVNVGSIIAKTNLQTYAGSAFSSGFAHQMMNTSSDVPDLSYNNNKVNVKNGNIEAYSNKKGAVASGFVSNSGRDYYNRPDHIYENSVYVNGSIIANSKQADATASGYSYINKTHRRNCNVIVKKDIIAQSPVQAVASGFNGLQYIDNYYFINNSTITVYGDIKAEQTENQQGITVASGLNGVIISTTSGSASNKVTINGNEVNVYGNIISKNNAKSIGYSGLIIGLNEHTDSSKGQIELNNNTFTGKENLIEIKQEDKNEYPEEYTNFTGVSNKQVYSSYTGNKVVFSEDDGSSYSANVDLYKDNHPLYYDMWTLSKKEMNHSINKVDRKEATCTKNGNIEYWYCTKCNKYFSDESLTTEITKNDTIIKAKGHKFNEKWYFDDEYHWKKCNQCGIEEQKNIHNFKWIIDKKATPETNGLKHEECVDCGYKKSPVEIIYNKDTQDNDNHINTLDNNNITLWIIMLFVSLFSIVAIITQKKISK